MEQSQTISEIAKALSKFQAEVTNVKKDGINPFFRSKYATLENVLDTIRNPLTKNGLSFSQFPTGENELTTILLHTSGEWLKSTTKMTPKDATPQGQGSAITYMRRYAISAVLGVASEEDDDGAAASGTVKKTPVTGAYDKGISVTKPPKKTEEQLKKEIYQLLLKGKFVSSESDAEEVKAAIKGATDLEATPKNYPEILNRLIVASGDIGV